MKKIALSALTLLLALAIAGCSAEKTYSKFYAQSEEAIALLEDAITTLDYCLDKTITVETCQQDLKTLAERYEGSQEQAVSTAALSVSIAESTISTAQLRVSIGTGTTVDVMQAVQDARDNLYDKLYGN